MLQQEKPLFYVGLMQFRLSLLDFPNFYFYCEVVKQFSLAILNCYH